MKHNGTTLFGKITAAIATALAVVAILATGLFVSPAKAQPGSDWTLTEVAFEQNSGCIFTAGQKAENLRRVVTVTAVYSEPDDGDEATEPVTESRVLEYSAPVAGNADAFKAVTGETVELILSGTKLTVAVTAASGERVTTEQTVTVSPESQKEPIGIYAEYLNNYEYELTTSSILTTSNFAVYKLYNNGVPGGEDDRFASDKYNVSVNLFPNSAIDFETEGVLYDTDVEITTNDTPQYSATARVTGIRFEKPEGIGSISGTLKTQTALSDLDIAGINVTLNYFADYSVPLSLFPESYYTCKYYVSQSDAQHGVNGSDEMTVSASWCIIEFTYPGVGSARGRLPITVSPISIHTPAFPTFNAIDYYSGVSVEISDLDYSAELGEQPTINVSVGDGTVEYGSDYYSVAKDDANHVYTVTFKKPNLPYVISLSLNSGDNGGNYQWDAAQINVTRKDEFVLEYAVQVNKSVIKLTSLNDLSVEWEYGGSYAGGADISGTIEGAENTELTFSYTTDVTLGSTAEDGTSGYYHLEYLDEATGEYSATAPKKAGRYSAIVVTHETAVWRSSLYYEPNTQAPFIITVTVSPVKIDPAGILFASSVTYDRANTYDTTNILSGEKNKFVDDDGNLRSALPLNITFKKGGTAVTSIKYAGEYAVELALTDDNFIFVNGDVPDEYYTAATKPNRTASNTFTVNKLEITPTATASGRTYGDGVTAAGQFSSGLSAEHALYANFQAAEYYTAAGAAVTEPSLQKWAAGDYYVLYKTEYGGSDADERNSCTFNSAQASFTVDKKALSPALSSASHVYDHDEHTVIIGGYDFANGDTNVLNKTVEHGGVAFAADAYSNALTVKNAGEYVITLTVKNANYKFADGFTGTLAYTVEAATASLSQTSSAEAFVADENDPAPVQAIPDFSSYLVNKALGNRQITPAELSIAWTITDGGGNTVTAITAAGTYKFTFTITGGTDKDNYVLADNLEYVYTIDSAKIKAPSMTSSSTYDGKSHAPSELISDWATYYSGYKLEFSVSVGGVQADGNKLRGAGSYEITVTPAASFEWEDGTACDADGSITYAFTMNKLAVVLDWAVTETVYGNLASPTVNVANVKSDDGGVADEVKVVFDKSGVTAAGEYEFTVIGLNGSAADNYTLDGTVASTLKGKFTVYKKVAAAPSGGEFNADFDGQTHSQTIYTGYDNSLFGAAISAEYPAEWFDDCDENIPFTDGITSFDVATGVFTYRNAGVYTVVFTINDADKANYCLDEAGKADFTNGGDYYSVTLTAAEISRRVVVAPSFGSARAMEYDKYTDAISEKLGAFASTEGLSSLVAAYGRRISGAYEPATSSVQLGGTTQGDIGQYYVLLSLADDMYNYVWAGVEKDDGNGYTGEAFIDGPVYKLSYTEDGGARVYLHYAITATQVNLKLTVTGYVFGDNGAGIVDEDDGFIANAGIIATDEINAAGAAKYAFAFAVESADTGIAIATITYKFTIGGRAVDASELVNGLPWNAGTYDVNITVTFTNPAYQPWMSATTVTVAARELNIIWKHGEDKKANSGDTVTLTYNGESRFYDFTPVITDIPVKNAGDAAVRPELAKTSSDLTDAGTHYIEVSSLIRPGDDNYTVTQGSAKLNVVITPATLTVKGVAVTHVYGDSMSGYSDKFVTSDTIYARDSQSILAARIEDGSGKVISGNLEAKVGGTYFVVPYIVESELGAGNYVPDISVTGFKASFTVTPRPITVTIDESKATSVYGTSGKNLNDNALGIYSVELPDNAVASEVFTLGTEAGDITAVTPVKQGGYAITCELADGVNYTLTFGAYVYTVTPAALNVSGTISNYSGTYNAQNQVILPIGERNKVTAVDGATVAWYYYDGAQWQPLDSLVLINACETADYRLKAEAANHEPEEFTISVTVDKALLTVGFTVEIYYGEVADWYTGYKKSLADLTAADGIYSVTGFASDADRAAFISGALVSGTFDYGYYDGVTAYARGDGAGSIYRLAFIGGALVSDNYVFTGEGTLSVEKLPVTVELDNTAYTATFGAPVTPVITVTTAAVSTRGGNISTDGLAAAYTVTNGALVDGNTNNVGAYELKVSPTVNYEFGEITVPYEITIATNGFADDGYSLFVGEGTTSVEQASAPFAWVYGDYSAQNPDGYNAAANAKNDIKPIGLIGEENALTVTVSFACPSGASVLLSVTDTVGNITAALKDAFKKAWSEKQLSAGDYTVYYRMEQSLNYLEFVHYEYFKVDKAELTVSPSDVEVVYGEEAEFGVEFDGFLYSGGVKDDIVAAVGESNVALVTEWRRWSITGYAAGADTGSYTLGISDIDGQNAGYFTNYRFVYGSGEITVKARKVLVTVKNATNRYMFIGKYNNVTSDYDKDTPAELGVEVIAEDGYFDYYNGIAPFGIRTSARFVNGNGNDATLDVGEYTIYLVYKDGKYSDNYIIEFRGCAMATTAADENAITFGDGNNAGKYTITPAQIRMSVTGPYYRAPNGEAVLYGQYEGRIYDGREKFYTARPQYGSYDVPDKDGITFAAVYYRIDGNKSENLGDGVLPKDVGTYSVRFFSTGANKNFEQIEDSLTTIEIAYKQVNVSSSAVDVVYNGQGQTLTVTFSGLIGAENIKELNTVAVKIDAEELDENTAANLKHASLSSSYAIDGNSVKITATEAAKYVVTLTLSADGNYAFAGSQSAYEFTVDYTFTIERAAITVWASDAFVQYGAPVLSGGKPMLYDEENGVAADRFFDGFRAVYGYYTSGNDTRPSSTNSDLAALIRDNIDAGYFNITFRADNYTTRKTGGDKSEIDVNAVAHNFDIKRLTNATGTYKATLTVVKRRISLNIMDVSSAEKDALVTTVYNNNLAVWNSTHEALLNERFNAGLSRFVTVPQSETGLLYGESGLNKLSDLAIKLIVGGISDAGSYPISIGNNNNFDITYLYGGNVYGGDNVVMYNITKATLYVKVHASAGSYNSGRETLRINYGDNISQETSDKYAVISSGWLNGDTALLLNGKARTVTFAAADGKKYTPYESHVGEEYIARVDYAEDIKNYKIECAPSYLNIDPRVISVASDCFEAEGRLVGRTYTAEADDYHDGYFGVALPAIVTFDGWNSNQGNAATVNTYMPTYKDSYNTQNADYNGVRFQTQGEAPRRAGNYKATITLDKNSLGQSDYLFAGGQSVTYDYSVVPRVISVEWELKTIDDEALESNRVREYCSAVMEYIAFTLNTVEVATTAENLQINTSGKGLTFTPDTKLGTYRMIIVFKSTAVNNYRWDGFDVQAIIDFNVYGEGLAYIKNVVMNGWTYGDTAVTPSAELCTKTGDIISGASAMFEYVRVNIDGEIQEGGITAEQFNGYDKDGIFTSSVPVNAGVYVMRARFDGNMSYHAATSVYYLFRINKKAVAALEPTIETAYNESDGAVNITATIRGFDTAALTVVGSEVRTRVESVLVEGTLTDNLVLTADRISPSGFSLVFKLASAENYEYEGEMTNGRIFVTWVVVASDENTVDFDENNVYTYTYGDSYELKTNTRFVVGNIVEYSYIDSRYATSESGVYVPTAGYDWRGGLPVHAGSYVVRAVSRTENNSYNTAYAYRELVINKSELKVRADGSAEYGMLSGNNGVGAYSDFVIVDPDGELKRYDAQTAVYAEIASGIAYAIDGVPAGVWGAGEYPLTFTAATADYEIVCVEGVFTVTKATISVGIDNNAWSYYGKPFDFTAASITVSGLIPADSDRAAEYISRIREKLAAEADENSGFGSYPLTVRGFTDDNYAVDVTNGVYTIRKLPVTVVTNDGGYSYGDTPVLPSVVGVYDGETAIQGFDLSLITFAYAGYDAAPVNAGRYGYSVSVAADCNYELAAPVSGIFEILRVTLDPSLIEFETVYYDGSVKAPTVVGVKDDAFDADAFDISYEGEWTNAGVAYTIVLTLKNTDNTGWLMVEGAEQRIAYTISRGTNALVADDGKQPAVAITGWTYGEYSAAVNAPSAKTQFGADQIVYEYSTDGEVWFRDIDTRGAGEYLVRAVVYETTDYEAFYSEPVRFKVAPVRLAAPVLSVVTSGEGKNDTYTAAELGFTVTGVDFELMNVAYDGSVRLNGNNVTVYATDAGSYTVRISLKNVNYTWADGVKTDENGNAILEWTIKKQKVALPTPNNAKFIINGTLLEYLPIGFDESLMTIDGNRAAYGGTFTANVALIDTDNYEWADGSIQPLPFTWSVVGANTVFIIVMSVLAAVCGALAIAAAVLFVRYRSRKADKSAKGANEASKEGND